MFDLELNRVIKEIKDKSSKQVLIQLPDGLKTRAAEIVRKIEEETQSEIYVWFSSCFGACDLPLGLDILGIDLIVQFGHNLYLKEKENW